MASEGWFSRDGLVTCLSPDALAQATRLSYATWLVAMNRQSVKSHCRVHTQQVAPDVTGKRGRALACTTDLPAIALFLGHWCVQALMNCKSSRIAEQTKGMHRGVARRHRPTILQRPRKQPEPPLGTETRLKQSRSPPGVVRCAIAGWWRQSIENATILLVSPGIVTPLHRSKHCERPFPLLGSNTSCHPFPDPCGDCLVWVESAWQPNVRSGIHFCCGQQAR